MTIDEMIAVLQAAKAGKAIEARPNHFTSDWQAANEPPDWNFRQMDYRVKPEPREWMVEVNQLGNIMGVYDNGRKEYVKVREVLE